MNKTWDNLLIEIYFATKRTLAKLPVALLVEALEIHQRQVVVSFISNKKKELQENNKVVPKSLVIPNEYKEFDVLIGSSFTNRKLTDDQIMAIKNKEKDPERTCKGFIYNDISL